MTISRQTSARSTTGGGRRTRFKTRGTHTSRSSSISERVTPLGWNWGGLRERAAFFFARMRIVLNATRSLHRLEGVDLCRLAEHVPTPFYAYSASAIRERIAELERALSGLDRLICYAAKANSNLAVLQIMQQAGLGADIVSGGELQRCLRAGIPASRIVFSGVGKTEAEMEAALRAGIWKFNVESFDELHALERLAAAQGTIARAAVRLNPDVDAGTHRKISTGRAESKFGVALHEARRWFANARELKAVRLDGLHVHIGSQILSLDPF